MNQDDTQAEAVRRRDAGMEHAATAKPDRVAFGRFAMLSALLRLPNHVGTIDDATGDDAIRSAYEDGGKWRGTVTRSLAKDGFIEKVDAIESRRTSRNCGYVTRWRLVDPAAAQSYVGRLRAVLDAATQTGPMAATIDPVLSLSKPSNGETTNGKAN